MQEYLNIILRNIERDSILTLLAIIAIIVTLVILLVLVVSSMRIKIYKDRWWNVKVDNQEKSEYIREIERKIQALQVQDATNNQELLYFAKTRQTLKENIDEFANLQKKFYEYSKELAQTQAQLDYAQETNETLKEKYQSLRTRFDNTVEENMKHRSNNARLLSKIEIDKKGNT